MTKTLLAAATTMAVIAAIAESNNSFSLDLYRHLAAEKTENLIFSPNSVYVALAMTQSGAAGSTAEQMAKVLHFSGDSSQADSLAAMMNELNEGGKKGQYELVVANALWGMKGLKFKPDFIEQSRNRFGAGLTELDFSDSVASAGTINQWVEKQTREKIKNLILPGMLDRSTVLVLTNAIYFKGKWELPFKKEQTRLADFSVTRSKIVQASMMNQTARFGYGETADMKMLSLPYAGRELAMVVLLPGSAEAMMDLEKQFSREKLDEWLKNISDQRVAVTMPKFKVESSFELAPVLAEMGMSEAFGGRADFSKMADDSIAISNVVHKAFVEVNEEGTEAAAATGVIMSRTSMQTEMKSFVADRPFIFLIRHQSSGAILFMGKVIDPTHQPG